VRAITDLGGIVVNSYAYDGYGNAEEAVEGLAQRFRYTGREWDDFASLYHYRARAYDGHRFLQEDPLGFDAGDLNVYRYVFANPTNFMDPSGSVAVGYVGRAVKSTAAGAAIGASTAVGVGCSLKVVADLIELINPRMSEGRLIARECDAIRLAKDGALGGAMIVASSYTSGLILSVTSASRASAVLFANHAAQVEHKLGKLGILNRKDIFRIGFSTHNGHLYLRLGGKLVEKYRRNILGIRDKNKAKHWDVLQLD
jgi:RHS repeat-associated protein